MGYTSSVAARVLHGSDAWFAFRSGLRFLWVRIRIPMVDRKLLMQAPWPEKNAMTVDHTA